MAHLAKLYKVESRALVQAIKRNSKRFPGDFKFRLSAEEFANLKSQPVFSSWNGICRAGPSEAVEKGKRERLLFPLPARQPGES